MHQVLGMTNITFTCTKCWVLAFVITFTFTNAPSARYWQCHHFYVLQFTLSFANAQVPGIAICQCHHSSLLLSLLNAPNARVITYTCIKCHHHPQGDLLDQDRLAVWAEEQGEGGERGGGEHHRQEHRHRGGARHVWQGDHAGDAGWWTGEGGEDKKSGGRVWESRTALGELLSLIDDQPSALLQCSAL